MAKKESAESTVRNIRRNTRKKYGAGQPDNPNFLLQKDQTMDEKEYLFF